MTSSRSRRDRGRPEPRREAARRAPPEAGERLQKVLAAAGVASRRASEELIVAGRVCVDGRVVTVLGTRVDPARARIEVDGVRVAVSSEHDYVILNKPEGVLTTARDPQGRPVVLDLVQSRARLYPVGRLDAATTGLVLLTNHGELAHRLAHPRRQVPRVYLAQVRGIVGAAALARLERGVRLEDGPARAGRARAVRQARDRAQVEIVMTEGRNREVRRMLEAVGHPVIRLARTRFGPLDLKGLPSGASRRLSATEVGALLRSVDL